MVSEGKPTREERRRQKETDRELAEIEHLSNLENTYIQDAAALLENASLETPFVVENVIPEEGVCFLAGKPDTMKSWIAYDAAIAVARGRPWLNFEVKKKGAVLVLNFDNPSHELGRRFLRLGLKPDDPIYFHSPAAKLPPKGLPAMLQLPQALPPLMDIVGHLRPRLIIVDSYRQAHTGDEHSSSDMGRIMSCFKQIAGCGSALLMLHHLRKQGQQKEVDDEPLRGSTEIEASADAIMIARGGLIELHKTRGWRAEIKEFEYEVADKGDRTVVTAGTELDVLISAFADGPLGKRELSKKIALDRAATDRLMQRALAAGKVKETRDVPGKKGTRLYDIVLPEDDNERNST